MECKKSYIKDFLAIKDTFFVIPVYQRNFCWEITQCRKLFDDILECIQFGKSHFLGTICYKADDNNTNVIIDGQQRITCLSLLLKSLFDNSTNDDLRLKINEKYLLNPCDNGAMKLKLKPIQSDASVYKNLLSHYKVDNDGFSDKEMNTPLFKAFLNFKVWIEELKDIDGYEEKLMDAIEHLEIIEIIVTNENPQEIFESLNATGLPLTNTDILRNFLLMTIPYSEQVRLYNTYWLPIEESVTTDEIENFVSSYLVEVRKSDEFTVNGKGWKINSKNICSAFRFQFPKLDTVEKLEDLFEDMYKFSQYYKFFVFDKNVNYNSLSKRDSLLYDLMVILKAKTFAPLLLYLFDKVACNIISSEQLIQILRIIISYNFRNYVCGIKSSFGYQFCGSIIRRLDEYNFGDDYISLFKKAISSGHGTYAFQSDILFEHALLQVPLTTFSTQKLKYLLYSIEKEMNPSQLVSFSGGTIEHIMPQTLSDDWKKYLAFNKDTEMYEQKLYALGNLTLSESNSVLSNKTYEDKKKIYADSIYEITKDICSYPTWTKEAIDTRGKQLYKIALKIWPYVTTNNTDLKEIKKYDFNSDLMQIVEKTPTSFSFLGEEVPVNSWISIGKGVVTVLYSLIPEKFEELAILSRKENSEFGSYISFESDIKKQSSKITDNLWLNQAKRPLSVLRQLKQLLDFCSSDTHSLSDDFWFTVSDSFMIEDDSFYMN